MIIKITVTEQDIKKGVKCSPSKCPIALAAKRTLKCKKVASAGSYIRINNKNETIRTPKTCTNFMVGFDLGYPVKPFSFTIDVTKRDLL